MNNNSIRESISEGKHVQDCLSALIFHLCMSEGGPVSACKDIAGSSKRA